ncbi:MAG: hypothetical protein PHP26_01265 [Syntrophomonas sp.]|nr:hypothetical protein [Syntrophomonas sp.]
MNNCSYVSFIITFSSRIIKQKKEQGQGINFIIAEQEKKELLFVVKIKNRILWHKKLKTAGKPAVIDIPLVRKRD